MWEFECVNCGGKEYTRNKKTITCLFCGSKFKITKDDPFAMDTIIDLEDDISRLLELCIKDPFNAKRYANLILELDPYNKMARRFL